MKHKKQRQQKKLWIVLTDKEGIYCIPNAGAIAELIPQNQRIKKELFYSQPEGLELFLRENPEEAKLFPKCFAWWVIEAVSGLKEAQNAYGMIRRKLFEFNRELFWAVKTLAENIAKKIKKINHPLSLEERERKRALAEEKRIKKQISIAQPKKKKLNYYRNHRHQLQLSLV